MTTNKLDGIKHLASRYIWWQTPDEVMTNPERLIAQIMNMGDYSDVQVLVHEVGNDALREVLSKAQAGYFNPRSWHYWHYRLGLTSAQNNVPSIPVRTF